MRRHVPLASAALAALLVAGCGDDGAGGAGGGGEDEALASTEVALVDADGADVGMVFFAEDDGGVRVEAELTGLEPGFHGFHLHQTPACDPDAPDGPFTSAEGHWAPADETHGEHAGDLPPLLVAEDGTAEASFLTDRFTLSEVADHGGVAVVVHAGPDNLANVPDRYTAEDAEGPGPDEDTRNAGDAGDRAACGILEAGDDGEA